MPAQNPDWPPKVQAFFDAHPTWLPTIPSYVPTGWDALVADCLQQLLHLSQDSRVSIQPAQIKEKFGALRLYLTIAEASAGELEIVETRSSHTQLRSAAAPGSVRAQANTLVDAAAERSRTTCMQCGALGAVVDRSGYLMSACRHHAQGGKPVED